MTRGWLNADAADAIERGDLAVGMTKKEMILAWGEPRKSNTSTNRWGTHIQYIYGNWGPYVYTENGIVTSWQSEIR